MTKWQKNIYYQTTRCNVVKPAVLVLVCKCLSDIDREHLRILLELLYVGCGHMRIVKRYWTWTRVNFVAILPYWTSTIGHVRILKQVGTCICADFAQMFGFCSDIERGHLRILMKRYWTWAMACADFKAIWYVDTGHERILNL